MTVKLLNKRLTKAQRQAIEMPDRHGQALVGLLLGDGFLTRQSPTANTRFGFAQTGKPEKHEYFWHVFNLFTMFCTPGLEPYIKTFIRKGSDVVYTSISFVTLRLPCFNTYYQLFYLSPHGTKIVPYNIIELLTAVGLAYFIRDDARKAKQWSAS